MSVKITTDEKRVFVSAPYNPDFPHRAKRLGGKWSAKGKAWAFDIRDEERIRNVCLEVFGDDGSAQNLITLRCTYAPELFPAPMSTLSTKYLAGREVARAMSRDGGIDLGEGVVIIKGWLGSGGSVKNPTIRYDEEGTVFEIRDVVEAAARNALDEHPGLIEIIDAQMPPHDQLISEKQRLMARLAKIEEMLAQ